jgi:SAM-dependent methyltransferase
MSGGTDPIDPYERIAVFYDIEHDQFVEDIECYASLLAQWYETPARVLEIGAGTGRIAAALAVAGHRVTAVEPSVAMRARLFIRLAQLPERVMRRVRVVDGSAAAPALEPLEHFDVVLFGQGVFAHLLTHDDRHRALQRARSYLDEGGRALIDVDLAGPRRLFDAPGRVWWLGTWSSSTDGSEISHFVAGVPGNTPDIVDVAHFYDAVSPDGAMRRTTARMSLSVFSPSVIELAALRAGFTPEEQYGGYDLAPLEPASTRQLLIARA